MALKIRNKSALETGHAEGTIDGHRAFEVKHHDDKIVMEIRHSDEKVWRHERELSARELTRAAVTNFIYAALSVFRNHERGLA